MLEVVAGVAIQQAHLVVLAAGVMALFTQQVALPVGLQTQVVEVAVVLMPHLMEALEALVSSSFVGLNHYYHPLPQQEALR
jgi:hypothetical protein